MTTSDSTIGFAAEMTGYQRMMQLATAYLLVACPHCGAWRGMDCRPLTGKATTSTHAARRRLVAGMSEDEILADYAQMKAEEAERRAASAAVFAKHREEQE